MKINLTGFIFILIIVQLHFCCSRVNNNNNNTSRVIKYESSGNFPAGKIASYTIATGSTFNEPLATLPWTKEITYATNVTAAIIAVSGNGGLPGQTVTTVVKRGGAVISNTIATTDTAGSFSKSAPVIVF